jgi:transposase
MSYIQGSSREQVLLFPEIIEEYISSENPVRFINAFVDGLDIKELGFLRAEIKETGRPPYDPKDLLKLYIYGYLYRIRSSRLLERETIRNVEVMWLLRKLRPDFKTVADFRRDNLNALKGVCREFTLLCRKLELFGGELLGVDGSKFRAVNSKKENFNEKKLKDLIQRIDQRTQEYLQQLDRADQQEVSSKKITKEELQQKIEQLKTRRGKYDGYLQELEQSGDKQISTVDSESRLMSCGQGLEVCYNVQTVVDSKHKLIVEHEVVNEGSDQNQLSIMAIRAKETLGLTRTEVLADKGFYHGQEIKKCEEAGIEAYVSKPETPTSTQRGFFGKEQFVYNAEADCYRCPAAETLTYRFTVDERGHTIRYYMTEACHACTLRKLCTDKKKGGRRIGRREHEDVLEKMHQRLRDHPEKIKLRGSLCEHPFGTIKRSLNAGYFLTKGLKKVRAEMSLSVLVYNLKRVINILGVKAMVTALA